MALIGKIRQKTGLLLGFIGIALLIFLIQAALNDGSSLSFGNKAVGKIEGKKVSSMDFQTALSDYASKVEVLNPDFKMDEAGSQSLSNEVWNEFIADKLLGSTFKNLGLTVSDKEISDAFTGKHIHPLVYNIFGRYFINQQTGEFDKVKFDQILKNMDKNDPSGNLRKLVTALESIIDKERVKEKYTSMLSKSFYTPTFLAQESITNNKTVLADVVYLSATAIPDSDIKVSDDEIKSFIEKNPGRFKQKEGRVIDVVTFDIAPSEADMANINQQLNALVVEAKTTTEDSLFYERNALKKNDKSYYDEKDLSTKPNAAEIIAAAPGTFIGPYRDGSNMVVTKVLDKKSIPDSVSASHILLKVTSQEEMMAAEKLADSIIAMAKSGAQPFEQLALTYSTDDGSKVQGGSLGTFPKNKMVKPFNDKVFYEMSVGSIDKVYSEFGLHIIKKTGQTGGKPSVRIADLYVEIAPSKETEEIIHDKANDFFQRSQSAANFDKNSKSLPVLKDIFVTPDQVQISGLGASKDLQQWIFTSEEPGVVNFFDLEDKFAVVKLKSFREAGEVDFESAKSEVKNILVLEKKVEMQRKKLEAAAKAGQPLDQIAASTGALLKTGAPLQYSSSYVDGVGMEPKIVGAAFGMKEGQQSKAIAGTSGAFIVKDVSVIPSPVQMDINAVKSQNNRMFTQRYNFQAILNSLKENVKIEDKRFMF